jgi:hypothetical protein
VAIQARTTSPTPKPTRAKPRAGATGNLQGLAQGELIERSANFQRLKPKSPAHIVYVTSTAMRTNSTGQRLMGVACSRTPDFMSSLMGQGARRAPSSRGPRNGMNRSARVLRQLGE